MKVFDVDLYEYFGIKKGENYKGILTCYILNNSEEICITRKRPAMLVLPGGGYGFVSFREAEPVALKYIEKDFNTFVLNYTVSPTAEFPTQLIEASMAMIYIRENADKLNTIKDKVGAVGFSAGGHLCGMLGNCFNRPELDIFKDKKQYIKPETVLLIYPVISYLDKPHKGSFDNLCGNNEKLKEELSLEKCVTKESSPAFIVGTYEDNLVPVKNSLLIACAYEEAGVPFSLHIFGKGYHGLSIADKSVYNDGNYEILKTASNDFRKWVKLSYTWLTERDFINKDI